jgi:hypothetical protein
VVRRDLLEFAVAEAIVTVVPMPAVDGSASERSQIRRFASAMIDSRSASPDAAPPASSSASAASFAAISPARAPPIPSAIAKSGGWKT